MLNAKRTPIDETLDLTQFDEYKEFVDAMDDDLNTSKALAVLFDLTNKANKDVPYAFTLLHKLAETLGFTFVKATLSEDELKAKLEEISKELGENYDSMEAVIETRKQARADKDWKKSDELRDLINKKGYEIKDTKDGMELKKIKLL